MLDKEVSSRGKLTRLAVSKPEDEDKLGAFYSPHIKLDLSKFKVSK
jgi:hypothetical protein